MQCQAILRPVFIFTINFDLFVSFLYLFVFIFVLLSTPPPCGIKILIVITEFFDITLILNSKHVPHCFLPNLRPASEHSRLDRAAFKVKALRQGRPAAERDGSAQILRTSAAL